MYVKVPNGCQIPSVLLLLENALIEMGGLEEEGIFRIAPADRELKFGKMQLNAGSFDFDACDDAHCISNLIKVHIG